MTHPAGGDKSEREAKRCARRAMKYLTFCLGDNNEESISEAYVDCCIGSPTMILSFVKAVGEDWKVGSSCALTYVQAVQAMMDYRKTCSLSEEVLRSFIATEVYLRNSARSFIRRKRMEYVRNLTVERLIAANSWATLKEMEKVIPFHTKRFTEICRACTDGSLSISNIDLVFATRFIITFLFLRVKSTRPMSYQFLTIKMFEESKKNGGYVDQTEFKTNKEFLFDTLIFSTPVLDILQRYIDIIRPRCEPVCEYVIVNTSGNQYTNFSHAMNLLTYEAIGKFINPTRWRMMIESESSIKLDAKDQDTISKDQKHSSTTAKLSYRKRQSREIAAEGKTCVQKLTGVTGENHTAELAEQLKSIEPAEETDDESKLSEESCKEMIHLSDTEITKDTLGETPGPSKSSIEIGMTSPVEAVEIKEEEDTPLKGTGKKGPKYTTEEDAYLKAGLLKYGKGNWSRILRDPEYKFHTKRTRDGLRMRAGTLKLVKKKDKSNCTARKNKEQRLSSRGLSSSK